MQLEDTLNGGYLGLYNEVVTEDCYRLKTLPFVPDVIFDVGANIGVFARYARTLFPEALIVCLEPDPENIFLFRGFTQDAQIILIDRALGNGQIYHGLTARNGSGETYLSAGLGYPDILIREDTSVERSSVRAIRFDEFVRPFVTNGEKYILKLDCEGAENSIWGHPPSMAAFRRMDYIAAELHRYAINGAYHPEVCDRTADVINSLKETHAVTLDNVHLWAINKFYVDTV